MVYDRRLFAGAAAQTTISGNITATSLTITIAAATGWPSGADEFYAVIDPGQATEEKILCTRSSTTLTCASTAKRGVDGTAAASHSNGAVIYPCVTAADLDEANELVSTLTTRGDILTLDATPDFKRLAVGSANTVLVSDGSDPSWAQVDTANLADGAVTTAKLDASAVGTSNIASLAVTAAKLANDVYSKPLQVKVRTANYTLDGGDEGYIILVNSSSPVTITIPADATYLFDVGTRFTIIQQGTGTVTIAGAANTFVYSLNSALQLAGRWGVATITKITTATFVVSGDLV